MTQYGLTHGQYLKARRIKTHRPGATAKYIALHIGATENQVRQALDLKAAERPVRPPRAKNVIKRSRPGLKLSGYQPCGHRKAAGIPEMSSMSVPHDVMAEREYRLSLPSRPFGDPPPGYSALDKRQG